MQTDYDLFVIGGGSGGVRCARIAAGFGAKVGIAEGRFWGGTCVNVGCVPKKIMVQAAEYGGFAQDAVGFGWSETAPSHDWAALIAAKDREIARLNGIYAKLLRGAGVEIFEAWARFEDPHTLVLTDPANASTRRVTARQIVIASGGAPLRPAIPGAELGIVSDHAFHLPHLPRRVTIVGGGYIAVEFAGIFHGLGAAVDLVIRQPLPLRGFDHDLRCGLADALTAQGLRLHLGTMPVAIEAFGEVKRVALEDGATIEADLVFFAVGRAPATASLGLDLVGVATRPNGAVAVDESYASTVPHIYAIGDVSSRFNLTPVAIAEGHHLADRLFGPPPPRSWSFDAVPTAVFCSPPIATCGLTEQQAAARGPADVYLTHFTPMRHTISGRARKSLMKLVVDQATDRVLGVHMLGEDAPELMQGMGVALTAGATKRDFDRTIGIHPTAAEEFVTLRSRTRVAST